MVRWALLIIAALSLTLSAQVSAQQAGSQLQQTVNPIECVFTQVSSGGGLETSSNCANHVAPTLEQVTVQPGVQPVLLGNFTSAQTKNLRIWVGGTWYTLGSSPYMSVNDDAWQLSLLNKPVLLQPGTYTIVVEALTHDSFLLSSIYVDALTVPPAPPVTEPEKTGKKIEQRSNTPRSPSYGQNRSVIFPLEQFELPVGQNRLNTYAFDFENKASSETTLYVAIWWLLVIIGLVLLVASVLFFVAKRKNNDR